jgi:hypothetical protein
MENREPFLKAPSHQGTLSAQGRFLNDELWAASGHAAEFS